MTITDPDVFGIDVSHYQSPAVIRNILPAFLWIKVTEGTSFLDLNRWRHYDEAGRLGIPRGAYHFFTTADPEQQAQHFAKEYLSRSWELPPTVDVEKGPLRGDRLYTFIAAVHRLTGVWPVVYTYKFYWDPTFGAAVGFETFTDWTARYPNRYAHGAKPAQGERTPAARSWGSKPTTIWQYSTFGNVDRDVMSLSVLRKLLGKDDHQPPATPPEEGIDMTAKDDIISAQEDTIPQAVRDETGAVWVISGGTRSWVNGRDALDLLYVLHQVKRDPKGEPVAVKATQLAGIPVLPGTPKPGDPGVVRL